MSDEILNANIEKDEKEKLDILILGKNTIETVNSDDLTVESSQQVSVNFPNLFCSSQITALVTKFVNETLFRQVKLTNNTTKNYLTERVLKECIQDKNLEVKESLFPFVAHLVGRAMNNRRSYTRKQLRAKYYGK